MRACLASELSRDMDETSIAVFAVLVSAASVLVAGAISWINASLLRKAAGAAFSKSTKPNSLRVRIDGKTFVVDLETIDTQDSSVIDSAIEAAQRKSDSLHVNANV